MYKVSKQKKTTYIVGNQDSSCPWERQVWKGTPGRQQDEPTKFSNVLSWSGCWLHRWKFIKHYDMCKCVHTHAHKDTHRGSRPSISSYLFYIQIHQLRMQNSYFSPTVGNLHIWRANCMHCSTSFYIRDVSIFGF